MDVFYLGVTLSLCFTQVRVYGCPFGTYGPACDEKCGHCLGGHAYCDLVTGSCRDGCASGYDGETCHGPCSQGTYGLGCWKSCPQNCRKERCDHVDGNCVQTGCKSGFMGKFCTEECPAGRYGPNCDNVCRCAEGCMCDRHGNCLRKGCKPRKVTKKKKRASGNPKGGSKSSGSGQSTKGGLMCSDMQNTFLKLKETLNKRVEVQIWPLIWMMIAATVVIVIVGVV
ncbi:hypothetical protein RRG08_054810 [Elysia crispata]|uniref:Scavenger receptor class F member 2 n=1 Tax=Elysia crispata TaxID=231223 RepID=A0AAE0YG12_9GAST|nr:hypothetical protein RRG08_054810 [Elysia crispata]